MKHAPSSSEDREVMDQFNAHLDRGWELLSRGDFSGALLSAQKSLELDEESPEAHNLMGYIHAAEGDADGALEHYQRAIDIDESYIEAMLNAAEVLIHPLREFESAIEMVESALEYCENDEEMTDAMLVRIDALLQAGRRDEASECLARLPEGPFENPQVDFLIGRAKFETQEFEGAEKHLRRAIEREGKSADAHYYLGLVLDSKKDSRGATASFLRTRELDQALPHPAWAAESGYFEERVKKAVERLPEELRAYLEGTLVLVADAPGVEVVAEGVDPRATVLLDDIHESAPAHLGRLFVYQRNLERSVTSLAEIEDEIYETLKREIEAAFSPSESEGSEAKGSKSAAH